MAVLTQRNPGSKAISVTKSTTDCDVLIIGGGLVGASLACMLENTGLSVQIVEAWPLKSDVQPSYDDRTVALSWGSRCIFEGMGIWDAMADRVEAIKTIHISDRGHFGATRLRHDEENVEALGYVAENRVLGEVLYDRLQQNDRLVLHCPAGLTGIEQNTDQVVASIEQDQQHKTVNARLLVAADGVISQVRDLLHIGSSAQDYGQAAVIANVTPARPHNNVAYERFTDQGPIAFLPMTGRRCSVVWTVPVDQAEALMALGDEDFLRQLQQRFGYRLGQLEQAGKRQMYPLRLVETTQVARNRVVIVGNAAHSVHPVAGQGFNLALRDIAMLAELMSAAKDPGERNLLQSYVEQREDDARRVYRFTDSLVKIFSNSNAPLGHLRAAGLIAVGLIAPLRHQLARQSMGLGGRASVLGRRSVNG
ncbi:MAG: 2-octaprenyl-6-methoxyphenyl hydroxylase [Thiotrichales bacterium]|nr:MAG: 2-octaprenyl-6-methoxyphenyl hydroxylase [Thiotrichales bacterium]